MQQLTQVMTHLLTTQAFWHHSQLCWRMLPGTHGHIQVTFILLFQACRNTNNRDEKFRCS